jgi:predicted nucleic acid-binding protein
VSYLLDTSFWYALLNAHEQRHSDVLAVAQRIAAERGAEPIVTATPVTAEVAYLVQRDLGQEALAGFIESLGAAGYLLAEPTTEDYERAAKLVRQYGDSRVDFVDAVLVAVAERLEISRVLTLDQRHFRLFRPSHIDAFEILP